MKSLTVFYDSDCGLCLGCMRWVRGQRMYFPVHFIAQGSDEAKRCYPRLAETGPAQELIAVADNGAIYRDDKAWLIVLYALRRYRPLAMKLARPRMRGLARRAYHWVSRNRHSISKRLGVMPEPQLHGILRDHPEPPTCRREADHVCHGSVPNNGDEGIHAPRNEATTPSS